MDNMELAIIAAVSFAGGLVYALYFWLDSGEDFERRKFAKSCIAALFAGVIFGIGYSFVDKLSMRDILLAFASGIGFTAAGSKVLPD